MQNTSILLSDSSTANDSDKQELKTLDAEYNE